MPRASKIVKVGQSTSLNGPLQNNDEAILQAVHLNCKSSAYVKKRNLQEAKVTLDQDNICLRKKLDLIKYQSDKKIIRLENQLHRVSIMQMEADTIRKKYKSISSSLRMDASFYASYLDKLDKNISNQVIEIKRLQKIKEEAIEVRDATKEALIEQEIEAMRASREREILIQEYRKCVEDRKMDLERLERSIFPTKSFGRDDLNADQKSQIEEDVLQNEMDLLEEVFIKLRNATGVSKTEDVLNRFLMQQATQEKLKRLQRTTEKKKVELEKTRQQMTAEIEMQKFSETKDTDQNTEKLEKLSKQMHEQSLRQEMAAEKLKLFENLLKEVKQKLLTFCDKFEIRREIVILEAAETSNIHCPMEALHKLNEIINKFIEKIGDPMKFKKLSDEILNNNDEAVFTESGNMINDDDQRLFPHFSIVATPAAQPQASEDEEDVPSRSSLKKQAQLLVDTKSRRKGFPMKR
ncbi:PREDICTED: hyaluronan-mediated motility receptor [Ceratosolen solmsi marchali]|uniref:Hyaluronan-mediated motility receptor n=1 Tax=Ceratosolen solmsi marchali TaxID=326594 RepID=A0AAJ6YLU8_9HYME|nr:PREDICTED: hyaluronan-mediated motility receptor [Ceratosolen solmsi marchali]